MAWLRSCFYLARKRKPPSTISSAWPNLCPAAVPRVICLPKKAQCIAVMPSATPIQDAAYRFALRTRSSNFLLRHIMRTVCLQERSH